MLQSWNLEIQTGSSWGTWRNKNLTILNTAEVLENSTSMYTGYLVRWRAIYTRAAQLTACERMRTVIICIKVCIRHHSGNFRHMHTKFLVLSLFFSSQKKKSWQRPRRQTNPPPASCVLCLYSVIIIIHTVASWYPFWRNIIHLSLHDDELSPSEWTLDILWCAQIETRVLI